MDTTWPGHSNMLISTHERPLYLPLQSKYTIVHLTSVLGIDFHVNDRVHVTEMCCTTQMLNVLAEKTRPLCGAFENIRHDFLERT